MHYDKKTGLAIAVLLCGIVAALFFRNDPKPAEEILQLKQAAAIDRQIEEDNAHTPVGGAQIGGLIDSPEDQENKTEIASNSDHQSESKSNSSFFNKNNKTTQKSSSTEPVKNEFTKNQRISQIPPSSEPTAKRPIPIKVDRKSFGKLDTTIPKHNSEWQVQSSTRKSKSVSNSENGLEGSTYTIRSGDTLSGLASRFLGSSGRYYELYQANRDVIDNPDNLRPGTEIRIPSERQNRTKTFPVSTNPNSTNNSKPAKNEVNNDRSGASKQTAQKNKKPTFDFQPKLIPARRRVYFRTPRWTKSKK